MLPSEPQDDQSRFPGSAAAADGEPIEDLLEREQRWQELVARLIERAEAAADPGDRVRSLVRAALVFETRLDDPERALVTLQAAFAEDFTDEEVAAKLGRLATGLDRWRAVLADCEALLPTLPGDRKRVQLLLALARFHDRQLNDSAAAEKALTAAAALDPAEPSAVRGLVELASRRGDFGAAVQRLTAAAQAASAPAEKVRLHLEAAALLESKIGDRAKAAEHHRQVLALVPGEATALDALGRLTPEPVSPPPSPLPRAPSSGAGNADEEESTAMLAEASKRAFAEERWGEARSFGARALARQGLTSGERAEIAERVGRACLALGDAGDAVRMLAPGVEGAPGHRGCREAMVLACEEVDDEPSAAHHRQALLALLSSDQERFEVLVRGARRLRDRGNDPVGALKLLTQALALRPDDQELVHDVLHEALDLHTAAKDWKGAVQRLERLAELETGRNRARYLVATANILNYQLHQTDQAIELYNQALDEDPDDLKSFERIEKILTAKRAWKDEARNFRRMLKRVGTNPPPEKRALTLMLWKGLGETCRTRLKDLPAAAAAFEVCAGLDPTDFGAQEILAEILERQGPAEAAKAVDKRTLLLAAARTPGELVRHIQALLRLHGERKQPDRIWCTCAALVALGAAEPKQSEFYQRFSERAPPAPRGGLNEEMWQRGVYHPAEDRRLSQLFATVSPSVALVRAKEGRTWGLSERKRLAAEATPVARVLGYAATLLGVGAPPLYVFADRPGLIDLANVVDHHRLLPSLVAGADLARPRPEREVAFAVGRALALLRFEHLVLWPHVVASTAELRAVLVAVLKFFQPELAIPPAEKDAVKSYLAALQRTLPPHAHEPLMAVVPALSADGQAADVVAWGRAALLTANRAGLLACGDPVIAAHMAAALAPTTGLSVEEAVTDLLRWSVSPEHLGIREQLGLAVDAVS
jgi:tetratricopeptide (TPR) repeat protein